MKPFFRAVTPNCAGPGDEEGKVTEISFILNNEVLQFDPDRIGALEYELGPEATEDVLFEATENLVDRLVDLRSAYDTGDRSGVSGIAQVMAILSDQVGLITISRVARDVVYCAAEGDDTGYHATYARLLRIGEGCVTGAFDFSDQYL